LFSPPNWATSRSGFRPWTQRRAVFQTSFRDGSFQPGDEEEIAEILVDGWGSNFFKRNGAAICQVVQPAKITHGSRWFWRDKMRLPERGKLAVEDTPTQ